MADTASQSNTQQGRIVRTAGETLTGMEGRFVLLTNSSGNPRVTLPNDVADEVTHVLIEGGASGADVVIEPLIAGNQYRVYIDGTCVSGDQITLAAINGTKDGKCVKLPATADIYERVGLSLASAADGSLALFLYKPKQVTVS